MKFKFIEKIKAKINLKNNHKAYIEQCLKHYEILKNTMEGNYPIRLQDRNSAPLTNFFLNNLRVATQSAMGLMDIANLKIDKNKKDTLSPLIRNNSFTNAGIGFGGAGNPVGGLSNSYANIGNTLGIMGQDTLTQPSYIYMTYWTTFYQTSTLAGRLVDVLAEAMVGKWISFKSKKDKHSEENIEKMQDFCEKIQAQNVFVRAIRQMWQHGGCALYINTTEPDQGYPLDPSSLRKTFIDYKFVDQGLLVPVAFEGTFDFSSDHFNSPEYWQIVFPNGRKSPRIHYTRFIFFVPEELPFFAKINQQFWGNSIYIATHDDINNAERAFKSSGQLVQQSSLRFLKSEMRNRTSYPGIASAGSLLQSKNDSFQRAITQNGNAILLDKEDEIEKLEVSNLKDQSEMCLTLVNKICAYPGIPLTRFWGNPVAGFSSGDAEIMQWQETVKFKQECYARRPFTEFVQLTNWILFGKPDVVTFTFNPILEATDSQIADVALKNSQRRALDIQNGVPVEIILKEVARAGLYEDLKYDDCKKFAKDFEDKQMEMEKMHLESKDLKDDKSKKNKPTQASKSNQPENIVTKALNK
jgi:phage-related protein (TIGR01555 family)